MADKKLRCAIYTRKSSEEGLEQDFNSLHAQREACEAYIVSQKHEGWTVIPTLYDDGGYSGGSLERPALNALLTDIAANKIDVVVVYKVDRLTRSLADFAKIVEIFDANTTSFVSVTQAFNTTSSMGRLTLNVLLSFAQFEREVTGERIRDKIAASKAKGMWMGGHVPMGYRREDRRLVIAPNEASLVRTIFARYLELGTVEAVERSLKQDGIVTPTYRSAAGNLSGSRPFHRGHLYQMLGNVIYAGKIKHRGVVHEGLHDAIVDTGTWDAVQAQLAENSRRPRGSTSSRHRSLLAGLLRDPRGRRMGITHSNKNGVRHRYYRSLLRPDEAKSTRLCIPAATLEPAIANLLTKFLRDPVWITSQCSGTSRDVSSTIEHARSLGDMLAADDAARTDVISKTVKEIRLADDHVAIDLSIAAATEPGASEEYAATIREPIRFARRGLELKLIIPAAGDPAPLPDPALVKAVAQAHRWWHDLHTERFATMRDIARAYDTDERYAAFVLRLAFLSPELTRRIFAGTQPYGLTLHQLLWKVDLPVSWSAQQKLAAASSDG
ncbi:recombinase family protein [Ancylobacter polymorphus]|uniref:Recombinase family protein n=1 Tax=Ancylobacter polymorphus TaxID=223390 RepID=A0A9E6ZXB7_9HYPH|nr:recombinase family protein [Ancylobacter polymorphus]UOK71862.1 recombinase family protein [Ancylobacter polymorphus]